MTCLAYQVAPKARLLIVKVASPPQKTSLSFSRWTAYRFAAGILWAARNGADVINLSYTSTWDIPVFQEACRFCWERNIILVAAAGNALNNHDQDLYYYPAAYPWTIAVGGAEKKGEALEVWENSARGDYLDVLAPATGFWVQFPSYLSSKAWIRVPQRCFRLRLDQYSQGCGDGQNIGPLIKGEKELPFSKTIYRRAFWAALIVLMWMATLSSTSLA